MSHQPRPWPNNALEARDRSAEAAVRAIRALRPLRGGQPRTYEDTQRRLSDAYEAVFEIAVRLKEVGAPIRAGELIDS